MLQQHKEMSGYDCGQSHDCIQADGSGYYVQPERLNISHSQNIVHSLLGNEHWSIAPATEWLFSVASVDLPVKCQYGVRTPGQQLFYATIGKWVLEPLRQSFYENHWPALSRRLQKLLTM